MPGTKEKYQGNQWYTSGLLFTSVNIHDRVWFVMNSATSQECKSSFCSLPAVENLGITKPESAKQSEYCYSFTAIVKIKHINLYKFLGKCEPFDSNSINTSC